MVGGAEVQLVRGIGKRGEVGLHHLIRDFLQARRLPLGIPELIRRQCDREIELTGCASCS